MNRNTPYISVIIPVYNAEEFVEEAVESALMQPEVAEVILVEDASPDGALAVCQRLAATHERVRLFRHPNGKNKGAGASRNLGIAKATCEWIAFLDADDYYLPERFKAATEKINANPEVAGVYSASLVKYPNVEIEYSTTKELAKHDFLECMLTFKYGSFHTNAILVKKKIVIEAGGFDIRLRTCQDTHLWIKLALQSTNFLFGESGYVSVQRIHTKNRVGGKKPSYKFYKYRVLMWVYLQDVFLSKTSKKSYQLYLTMWSVEIPYTYNKLNLKDRFYWHIDVFPTVLSKLLLKRQALPYLGSFFYRMYIKRLYEQLTCFWLHIQAALLLLFPRALKDIVKRKFFS